MKKSKYTFVLNVEPNILLMYNSVRGVSSFIKFYGDDAILASRCVENPNKYKDTEIHNILVKHGMIISSEAEEDSICTPLALKRIFNPTLVLIIMPTEDCNFRCSYCYEEHKKGIMNINTAESIVKYVQKSILNYTQLHIVWFGGEPLMSNETIDLILHISEKLIKICSCARRKYSADIITNGYNLTLSTFEQLLSCKIFSYQVTIDGLSYIHDKYRFLANGECTHDRIISNLLEIKKKCKKRYFNIAIRTNITSEMEPLLNEHFTELSGMFSDDSRFSFYFRPVGNWGGDSVKNLCNNMYDPFSFKNVYEKILIIQTKSNLDFGRFIPFFNNCTCSACYENSYVIGYDGKIYKCTCHFDEPNNEVGFLEKEGDIVLDINKIIKWVRVPELKKSCKSCFFAPVCLNMSCPIYSNKIKYHEKKTDDCPYERKYIKETLKLLEKSGYFKTINLSTDYPQEMTCKCIDKE